MKPSAIATKHKSETYEPEENGTDHKIDKVLKQDVRCIFTTGKARLAEGKSRLHEKTNMAAKSIHTVSTEIPKSCTLIIFLLFSV